MKKMLVLALVLAVAGLANASIDLAGQINGLSYGISGNTVTISSTVSVSGYLFALQTDNNSALSGATIMNTSFATGTSAGGDRGNGLWDGVSASVGTNAAVTGNLFKIDFAPGTKKIYFVMSQDAFDASAINIGGAAKLLSSPEVDGVNGSTYFMTIPEPMTMVLLGLGGLFLRKK